MITSKDAKKEMINGRKVVENRDSVVVYMCRVIYKIGEVILKVVLNNRENTVKIMKKLKIPLTEPRKKTEETTTTTETTHEPTTE